MGSVSRWSALARRFVTRGGRDGLRVTLVGSGTAFRDTPRPPALECHVARPLGGSEAAARGATPRLLQPPLPLFTAARGWARAEGQTRPAGFEPATSASGGQRSIH